MTHFLRRVSLTDRRSYQSKNFVHIQRQYRRKCHFNSDSWINNQ